MTEKFAIIGAAGFVAPRHLQAVQAVGGQIAAIMDPHDSVGIIDRFNRDCLYFREIERFDRWLSKNPVDYVVVCSPNYLHDSHCLLALRNGCNVICEKPVVCNERNLDNLAEWELKTGKNVNAILQCRLHSDMVTAKKTFMNDGDNVILINYRAPRGQWYRYSWKGDVAKSGGLATNIGIHLFDLSLWLLGAQDVADSQLIASTSLGSLGNFHTENGSVHWRLSIDPSKTPLRSFVINGETVDLTEGITKLHELSYCKILAGEGFGLEDARPAIRFTEKIREEVEYWGA